MKIELLFFDTDAKLLILVDKRSFSVDMVCYWQHIEDFSLLVGIWITSSSMRTAKDNSQIIVMQHLKQFLKENIVIGVNFGGETPMILSVITTLFPKYFGFPQIFWFPPTIFLTSLCQWTLHWTAKNNEIDKQRANHGTIQDRTKNTVIKMKCWRTMTGNNNRQTRTQSLRF